MAISGGSDSATAPGAATCCPSERRTCMSSRPPRFGSRPRPEPDFSEANDPPIDKLSREDLAIVRGGGRREPWLPAGPSGVPYKRVAEIEGARKGDPFRAASPRSAAARGARPGEPPRG